jgi:hypothetical protein
VRLLLSIAAAEGLHLRQLDVTAAFPNAKLEEEIYMEAPPQLGLSPGHYLKLLRALYGLKQASRQWNRLLTQFLISIGFTQCKSESCVFVRGEGMDKCIIIIYVDDIIIASKSMAKMYEIQSQFENRFQITNSKLNWCLGIAVRDSRDKNGEGTIELAQDAYIQGIVDKFKDFILPGPPKSTPMDSHVKLTTFDPPANSEEEQYCKSFPYREIIGSCMFAANTTRLDINEAVNICARHMENPGPSHVHAVRHILSYLSGCVSASITYSKSTQQYANRLECYADADHASDVNDRKSTSGYVIIMNNGPVSWNVSKQKTPSSSPTESEYKSLHHATLEVIWLRQLIMEMGYAQHEATIIYEDNESSIDCTRIQSVTAK